MQQIFDQIIILSKNKKYDLKTILNQPFNLKTPQEIKFIMMEFQKFNFFKNVANYYGSDTIFELAQYFTLLKVPRKTIVLNNNTEIHGLYILLEGLVSFLPKIGDALAEDNFLSNHKTCQEFKTLTPCTFLYISRQNYFSVISTQQISRISDFKLKQDFLTLFPHFQNMFQEDLNYLITKLTRIQVALSQYIQKKRQKIKFIFFILSGEFLISSNNPICVVGKGNILNFPDLLTSSLTLNDIQCISKHGGLILQIQSNEFLHKINYCFNYQTLNQLFNTISSKQHSTYSIDKDINQNQKPKDYYKELNNQINSCIKIVSGNNVINTCLMEKITYEDQIQNMYLFKHYAKKNVKLTRFKVETLLARSLPKKIENQEQFIKQRREKFVERKWKRVRSQTQEFKKNSLNLIKWQSFNKI